VQGYKDKFAVDKDRGYITLQQLLDIEDVGKVIMTVGASDHGKIFTTYYQVSKKDTVHKENTT
jgi:hypothetical protein